LRQLSIIPAIRIAGSLAMMRSPESGETQLLNLVCSFDYCGTSYERGNGQRHQA
jgi:hypothetical protein